VKNLGFSVGCCLVLLTGATSAFGMDMTGSIVGNWFDERTGKVLSIEHFRRDGSFSIEFRECLTTGARDHVESGHWSFSGSRLKMTTESVWERPVRLTAELETLSNNGTIWVRRIVGGDALRVFGAGTSQSVRVSDDSGLPGCQLTS
jgi:hypothetical protein